MLKLGDMNFICMVSFVDLIQTGIYEDFTALKEGGVNVRICTSESLKRM